MYEIFTYGRFEVPPENQDAFVAAWSEFAAWVSTQPGFRRAAIAKALDSSPARQSDCFVDRCHGQDEVVKPCEARRGFDCAGCHHVKAKATSSR